jgi:hypothetical protein
VGTPDPRGTALGWLAADVADWQKMLRRKGWVAASAVEYGHAVLATAEVRTVREPGELAKRAASPLKQDLLRGRIKAQPLTAARNPDDLRQALQGFRGN